MIMPDDNDPKAASASDAFPSAAANDAGPGAPGDAPEAAAFQPDPLAALEAEKADLKDKHLRTRADIENRRRRTEREVADARAYGIANFARRKLTATVSMTRAKLAMP